MIGGSNEQALLLVGSILLVPRAWSRVSVLLCDSSAVLQTQTVVGLNSFLF